MCYVRMISQQPSCVSLHMVHWRKAKECTSKQFGHVSKDGLLVAFVFFVCLLIGVAKSHVK